jgi:hypothetical protein
MVTTNRGNLAGHENRQELEIAFLAAFGETAEPMAAERLRAIPDAELILITRRLIRFRRECGCAAAARCMAVALVGAVILGLVHGAVGVLRVLGLTAVCAAGVLSVGVLAKVTVIAAYRARWHAERRRVSLRLAQQKGAGDVLVR